MLNRAPLFTLLPLSFDLIGSCGIINCSLTSSELCMNIGIGEYFAYHLSGRSGCSFGGGEWELLKDKQ